jgi:hypothetical protein
MSHLLLRRTRIRSRVGAAGLAMVAAVLGLLASAGVFAGGTAVAATTGGNSNEGEVQVTTAVNASPSLKTSEMYPFGVPTENPDFHVPSPPGSGSLVPTIDTKTTTRLYGTNPFQEPSRSRSISGPRPFPRTPRTRRATFPTGRGG